MHITGFDLLMVLDLSYNLIALVDELQPLNGNPCLYKLELKGNPIRGTIGYHQKVFERLKTLNVLDRRSMTGRKVNFARVKKTREEDALDTETQNRLSTIHESDGPDTLEQTQSRKTFKVLKERTSG